MTERGSEDAERELLLAQALAEFHDLRAREETVDAAAFARRYPELEAELKEQIDAAESIDRALEPVAAPAPAADPLPESLSGHRILGEIGAGGMGRVLLAFDERLGRNVAIKVLAARLRTDTALRARFLEEARAMARLSHPHVVRIYSLGREDEPPHFVMEYVEGVPLTAAAAPLAFREKAELMHKVTTAVDFLHRHHVLHRDLKPANILVGHDLEPKVLDFGLARQVDNHGERITQAGEVAGTPAYFSPEQAGGGPSLDARSDVFSLGAILYEMLTGLLPFRADTYPEQMRLIREEDPPLPRRIDARIPGDLQNICMKALEKDPAARYQSAREMAADLERFLAGEAVHASPGSYSRLMAGQIERHLRELNGWKQDQILSEGEYDSFRKLYERLVEREDAWIMEARRLSLPQVALYLGAWVLAVAAALVLLFHYRALSGAPAVLGVAAPAVCAAWLGISEWRHGRRRISIAYLLSFCLLLPIFVAVAMNEFGVLAATAKEGRELLVKFSSFKKTTNAQLWWSIFLSLPAYYGLRRFTRAPVFSLTTSVMAAALSLVTLLRMGMLEWLESDPGLIYLRLMPFALAFFAAGFVVERLGYASDSRYVYPVAVAFTLISLSGVALFHEPYANWLKSAAPWTRGQIEYLFVMNAGIYAVLQGLCDRFPSPQMRGVAKAFRFVIPGHVLTSVLLLGLEATRRWAQSPGDVGMRLEARVFEILLPALACAFVLGSIPKQMKNFFATGLFFLAIGVVRLQQNLLKDRAAWPLVLLFTGFALMWLAANYAPIRMRLRRMFRRG